MKKAVFLVTAVFLLGALNAYAQIDLVTLPKRDAVSITIYTAVGENGRKRDNLALVRETRELSLKKGENKLLFSWANTQIDPTSLRITPLTHQDMIDILELTYPPNHPDTGIWRIQSSAAANVPMEISYFIAGLSWEASYQAFLNHDETAMDLTGYIHVINQSGEDFENAEVSLVVGDVHVIERIRALANREHPYGVPEAMETRRYKAEKAVREEYALEDFAASRKTVVLAVPAPAPPKVAALSDYFLMTLQGRFDVPDGHAKRFFSFEATNIPVKNVFEHKRASWDKASKRQITFKHAKEKGFPSHTLPGGPVVIYRKTNAGQLVFTGDTNLENLPQKAEAKLELGRAQTVIADAKRMEHKEGRFSFDKDGNIAGWQATDTNETTVENTRDIPVTVECYDYFGSYAWELVPQSDTPPHETVGANQVKFTVKLDAREKKTFGYKVVSQYGRRAD